MLGWARSRVHSAQSRRLESLEARQLLSATLYWDPNSSSGLGGAGTWDTSSADWSTSPSGGGVMLAWSNGNAAVFAGTGVTVNLGSTTIEAAAIQFSSSNYAIASNTLTLPAGGTSIDVTSGNGRRSVPRSSAAAD